MNLRISAVSGFDPLSCGSGRTLYGCRSIHGDCGASRGLDSSLLEHRQTCCWVDLQDSIKAHLALILWMRAEKKSWWRSRQQPSKCYFFKWQGWTIIVDWQRFERGSASTICLKWLRHHVSIPSLRSASFLKSRQASTWYAQKISQYIVCMHNQPFFLV
jgi:hypothetical protein